MIYEYALEPELVATWTDPKDCRHFKSSFGSGQGRMVSRYPWRWKSLVWEACRINDDFARKRLEVLLASLSQPMVRRSEIHWENDSASWLENAESEHARRPFDRIRSEAAFAKLCGACPIPASSGMTTGRHRLNRGGHRHANAALYRAVIVRMQFHQPTRDYVARRIAAGRTKRDIIRCLKRFLAREIYQRVMTDFRARQEIIQAA